LTCPTETEGLNNEENWKWTATRRKYLSVTQKWINLSKIRAADKVSLDQINLFISYLKKD
jgi:hypothetical protein